ncbi:PH and SEC7 domain-containing protein 4-like isoform X3 [Athene noctua]|uniref:PH and SEC7 domain-containing protein 4-like isoform X3 n=1 Tax=Athene noctua TaxID=126797 RepID=UPI003EB9D57F
MAVPGCRRPRALPARGGKWRRAPPPSPRHRTPPWRSCPPRRARSPRRTPPPAPMGALRGGQRWHRRWQTGDRDGGGRRGVWPPASSTSMASRGPRWPRSSARTCVSPPSNDFSGMVAQEYLDFFQFGGQTLDQALRSFLQALVLTGETQERERILGHFSRRYHRCNPGTFPSPDAVHSLTCAIMLLNTDLHGQRLGRAMTSTEFVANLSGMMDGQDFPREQLKALYSSIRSEKLAWAVDEEEEEEEEAGGGGSLAPPGRKKSNPFLDLPGGSGALIYRRGWLARKVLAEADGKKTPWGRRGWKPFQAVLKGTVLYFLKPGGRMGTPRRPPEPGPFPAPQEEEGPEVEEPLGVHHALAERASKYTKRPNVFRLQTADWRVFLFQAPTLEEMFSWISRINLVAALFSSPPFPAAVGSQRRFVRPILPAAPSRSPPEEQHRSHEAWMERVGDELFEHQRNLPEKRGRARDLDEYRLKKEYLLYERRRYETYVQVLETWINAGGQDVEGWEAQAGPAVAPPDHPTLTKAHSSPSLAPEPPVTPTIRVKRNISERRTVRKIVPKRNKNLL